MVSISKWQVPTRAAVLAGHSHETWFWSFSASAGVGNWTKKRFTWLEIRGSEHVEGVEAGGCNRDWLAQSLHVIVPMCQVHKRLRACTLNSLPHPEIILPTSRDTYINCRMAQVNLPRWVKICTRYLYWRSVLGYALKYRHTHIFTSHTSLSKISLPKWSKYLIFIFPICCPADSLTMLPVSFFLSEHGPCTKSAKSAIPHSYLNYGTRYLQAWFFEQWQTMIVTCCHLSQSM